MRPAHLTSAGAMSGVPRPHRPRQQPAGAPSKRPVLRQQCPKVAAGSGRPGIVAPELSYQFVVNAHDTVAAPSPHTAVRPPTAVRHACALLAGPGGGRSERDVLSTADDHDQPHATGASSALLADLSHDPCLARLGLGTQLVVFNSVPALAVWLFGLRGPRAAGGQAGLGGEGA